MTESLLESCCFSTYEGPKTTTILHPQGSMGDLLSPKRRDVVDRLRRRIELYRRNHHNVYSRFEPSIQGLYEQHRQDTLLLRQRWLESKAKKASKQTKSSRETTRDQNEHRNLIVTQKLKKKIDAGANLGENPHVDTTNAYTFDESDSPPAKKSATSKNIDGQLSSVSVHIVQQISGGSAQQDQKQTIKTNVTVSSTLKSCHGSSDSPQTGNNPSANIETSVECKQEPIDTELDQCLGSNRPASSQNNSNDIFDPELEDFILNTLEKEENGEIPPEIIKELDEFDEIYNKVQRDSESNDSVNSSMFGAMRNGSPGLQKAVPTFADPSNINQLYDTNQNMNTVPTPPMPPNYRAPSQQRPMQTMTEAGPAAETLKQMAAQHQSQQNPSYGMKTAIDSFGAHLPDASQFTRRNGFPDYQTQAQQQQHYASTPQPTGGQYLGQQGTGSEMSHVQYPQSKQDISLNYGATKPLSHFPQHAAAAAAAAAAQQNQQQRTPSSLQQLQKQVHSHFNQSPGMQITQTQHMQVSNGANRMQMSQTQQLQMQQPVQQISLTQQQSFSMSPAENMAPNQSSQSQYMNEQMNMQMLQRQKLLEQQQQAHMQQYMNRPPPEYKMQSGSNVQNSFTSNNAGSNPLQTMQNMVNQTNSMQPSAAYVQTPKSEPGTAIHIQNGMMQSVQMSGMQMPTSATSQGMSHMTQNGSSRSPVTTTYPGQPLSRQQSYPGAVVQVSRETAAPVRTQRPSAPTYTSAIMRNQRPPNVNIGPDGLNISQPRNVHEWPRGAMMPGPRHAAPRSSATMARTPMSVQAEMMQYGQYSNPPAMNASAAGMRMQQGQPMQMSAMQVQAAMMQGNPQPQDVLMQQNLQMSQQMTMRQQMANTQSSAPPYNMGGSTGGMNTQTGGYPQTSSPQDDFMNLLDSAAQNSGTDFFDGIVQSSSGGTDANWLDEILGNR